MSGLRKTGTCADTKCGAAIYEGDAFCRVCGAAAPPGALASDSNSQATPEKVVVYVEPPAAFAAGLPEWSLEPPAVVVRRRGRK